MAKILFIPVSSERGIGEYQRSLNIASSLAEAEPNWDIRFVLNQHTSYAQSCPFSPYLLETSPTKAKRKVNQIIREFSPDVVIFDASGRAENFGVAKKSGASVIFISQHEKKMRRGFRYNRLKYLDEHIVVQPGFIMPKMNWLNRAKHRWLEKSNPNFVGPLYQKSNTESLHEYGLQLDAGRSYMLVTAGSGGHRLPDGQLAIEAYYKAAEYLVTAHHQQVIFIAGPNSPKTFRAKPSIQVLSHMDNSAFMALLEKVNGAVISGGSTLLQAIELGLPCVAAPISKDQPKRVKACADKGLCIAADASINGLYEAIDKLMLAHSDLKETLHLSLRNDHSGMKKVIEIIQDLASRND